MSRLTASPYEISRPTGLCAATGVPLTPGDAVVVALCERPTDEGFDRADFALSAWDSLSVVDRRSFQGRAVFAYWRTVQPEPNAKPRLLIDDESLLDLFEQTEADAGDGSAERRRLAFRFVLALILCRRRLLVHERSEQAGRGVGGGIYVRRRTRKDDPAAPLVRVADPGLDPESIAMATEQLGAALQGGA